MVDCYYCGAARKVLMWVYSTHRSPTLSRSCFHHCAPCCQSPAAPFRFRLPRAWNLATWPSVCCALVKDLTLVSGSICCQRWWLVVPKTRSDDSPALLKSVSSAEPSFGMKLQQGGAVDAALELSSRLRRSDAASPHHCTL